MTTRKSKNALIKVHPHFKRVTNPENKKFALYNSKWFKFRGRDCVIRLVAPIANEKKLTLTAGFLWDLKPLGRKGLKGLKEPVKVRGHYLPASFVVEGLGFTSFNFSIRLNDARDAIIIDGITIKGDSGQVEAVLPLDRLRIYAIQLAGVQGIAYPPNWVEDQGTWKTTYDAKGEVAPIRYGHRLPKRDAARLTVRPRQNNRIIRQELLEATARHFNAYKFHHGKYDYIATELNKEFPNAFITYRNAKELVAACRTKEVGLLEPTGRKRKTKRAGGKV